MAAIVRFGMRWESVHRFTAIHPQASMTSVHRSPPSGRAGSGNAQFAEFAFADAGEIQRAPFAVPVSVTGDTDIRARQWIIERLISALAIGARSPGRFEGSLDER